MVTAHDIRAFAKSNDIPVSKRGRIGRDAVLAFLYAHPAIVRQIALANDIPVGKRGRMSRETFDQVAGVL